MGRFAVRLKVFLRALIAARRRPSSVNRILVCHYLLLGDTVLLAPLLKSLAARFPHAERVLLVRPAFMPLFSAMPYGVTAIPFDRKSVADHHRIMSSGPYDVAIVPDDNRYAWLARACGARWIVGFSGDRPAWKNFMIDEPVSYAAAPRAWADMAAMLAGGADAVHFTRGEWPQPAIDEMTLPPAPYAVLHVGASTPLKQWPASSWRALADTLRARGVTVVWTGGEEEHAILDEVGVSEGEFDLVGAHDLAQFWNLLKHARVLVCPDTGIGHLARLVGVPTFAIFGPGSAVIHGPGEFWHDAPFLALTEPDFPCRDQRVLFRREIDWVRRCGRAYGTRPGQCARAVCMEAVGPDRMVEAIMQSALIGEAAVQREIVKKKGSPRQRNARSSKPAPSTTAISAVAESTLASSKEFLPQKSAPKKSAPKKSVPKKAAVKKPAAKKPVSKKPPPNKSATKAETAIAARPAGEDTTPPAKPAPAKRVARGAKNRAPVSD